MELFGMVGGGVNALVGVLLWGILLGLAGAVTLAERAKELETKRQELHGIFEKAKDADGQYQMDAATLADARGRNEELDKLTKEYEAAAELEKTAKQNAEELARLAQPVRPRFGDTKDEGGKAKDERKTIGRLLLESKLHEDGKLVKGRTAVLPDIDVKTLFSTSTGWDPEDLRTGRVVLDEQQPVPIVADIIPKTTTRMSTVLYMEETTYTNNAAEVNEGGTYGEGALGLTERSSEVRKIAVWIPVTDEQFEDELRAEAYVNARLRNMLRQRLDRQILTGDGSAPNLRGVLNVSGIGTQAKGADPTPDAIFKAMTQIRVNGFAEPSHVVMHPNDWQDVRLLRTADGMYIWGNPTDRGPERIWGLPVIATTYETENTAVVGDFRNYSELALRRGIEFEVTNSHSTHFIEGKKAIRADFRCALIFYRALAFCKVTGI